MRCERGYSIAGGSYPGPTRRKDQIKGQSRGSAQQWQARGPTSRISEMSSLRVAPLQPEDKAMPLRISAPHIEPLYGNLDHHPKPAHALDCLDDLGHSSRFLNVGRTLRRRYRQIGRVDVATLTRKISSLARLR
jgi:hypothetical protein